MLDEVSRGEWGSVTIIKRRKRKWEEWWAYMGIKRKRKLKFQMILLLLVLLLGAFCGGVHPRAVLF